MAIIVGEKLNDKVVMLGGQSTGNESGIVLVGGNGNGNDNSQTIILRGQVSQPGSGIILVDAKAKDAVDVDSGDQYPGLISSLVVAGVVKVLTDDKDGTRPATIDRVQNIILAPVRALHKQLKVRETPVLPTLVEVRKVEEYVAKRTQEITTIDGGDSLLGRGGMAALVGKRAEALTQKVMEAPIVGDPNRLTEEERQMAERLATMGITGTPVEMLEKILEREVAGRVQNIVLDQIQDELGANWPQISADVAKFFRAKPRNTFAVDPLSKLTMPPQSEKEKNAEQVTWSVTPQGIRFVYYAKGRNEVTKKLVMESKETLIPWSVIAFGNTRATSGDVIIANVSYPKYVESLQARLGPFLRGLITKALNVNDLVGQIEFKPASGDAESRSVEIPPIRVRQPKKVVAALQRIQASILSLQETSDMVTNILRGQEGEAPKLIRPKVVRNETMRLLGVAGMEKSKVDARRRLDEINKESELIRQRAIELERRLVEARENLGKITGGSESPGYVIFNKRLEQLELQKESIINGWQALVDEQRQIIKTYFS